MSNYTPEEVAAFARKDMLNARQSALKAASFLYEGAYESVEMEDLLEEAEKALMWLTTDQTWGKIFNVVPKEDVVSDITCPVPTVDQKKALDKVEQETGWNAAQVFAKFQKYPTNETADKCIAAIRKG